MVSNIDRVYATEYSRKKKKKEKFSYRGIDRLSTVFSPISTRVGREISIVSSDKTSACGEAAPDFERYERCNWPTAEARLTIRRDLETASTISLGRRWPPQLPFATLACERGLRRLFLNYYKWDRIFSFRLLPRFGENWLRFKDICCYIVLMYIYDSI